MIALWLLLLIPAISIITIFWGGYVASILWGWFVVPLGLPPISMLHAAGLACMINLFRGPQPTNNNDGTDPWARFYGAMGGLILGPALVLLVGWLIKQGM